MFNLRVPSAIFGIAAACSIGVSAGATGSHEANSASNLFSLSPPEQDGPIEVLFDFEVHDINEINGVAETFELTGEMTLTWTDPREAFDPDAEGVNEKIFQGHYQFNELATGWYPQVVLVNEAGAYQKSGVQLRIKPDGTSILREKITAVAETDLDMRSFPFDSHQVEAVFAVLGHNSDEVVLRVDPRARDSASSIRVPEWSIESIALAIGDRPGGIVARTGMDGAAILDINIVRESIYVRRLITMPMAVIVMLSFSIFWMDKSSLSERNSVSFIGILTGVAYQQIVVNVMPPVSYFTFMHGFLFTSFLVMSATVPINLAVATMDKKGRHDLGDRIDLRCRWIFPLLYFGTVVLMGAITLLR